MERTLILIKPDAVKRNLIGKIINRFEERGLKICGLKMLKVSQELAAKHYQEHLTKPFYQQLLTFITSGPIIAMVLAGEGVIKLVRQMMGTTNSAQALPGTIRGDYAFSKSENVVHGSDSEVSAVREINNFFSKEELCF